MIGARRSVSTRACFAAWRVTETCSSWALSRMQSCLLLTARPPFWPCLRSSAVSSRTPRSQLADGQVGQLGVEPIARGPLLDPTLKTAVARRALGQRHVEGFGHGAGGALDVERRDEQRTVRCFGGHASRF